MYQIDPLRRNRESPMRKMEMEIEMENGKNGKIEK
jgi:hypothetical protein